MSKVLIDLVAEDSKHNEFVLYLVENGPWEHGILESQLKRIQKRLYDAVDVVIEGYLASKYPQSKARRIRIQVDCYNYPPPEVDDLIFRFRDHLIGDSECQQKLQASPYVKALRIVTGVEMGRELDRSNE